MKQSTRKQKGTKKERGIRSENEKSNRKDEHMIAVVHKSKGKKTRQQRK